MIADLADKIALIIAAKCKLDLLTCECIKCCDKRIAEVEIGCLYRLVEFPRSQQFTSEKQDLVEIPWWLPDGHGDVRRNLMVVESEIFIVISSAPRPTGLFTPAWLCMSSRGPIITLGKWLKRI